MHNIDIDLNITCVKTIGTPKVEDHYYWTGLPPNRLIEILDGERTSSK